MFLGPGAQRGEELEAGNHQQPGPPGRDGRRILQRKVRSLRRVHRRRKRDERNAQVLNRHALAGKKTP